MFNRFLNKFVPVYDEGQVLPKKLCVVRREVSQDRMRSVWIIIPSLFKTNKGVYDPDTFKFYPNAVVRKIFALTVRFPIYKKVLFKWRKSEHIIKYNRDNK